MLALDASHSSICLVGTSSVQCHLQAGPVCALVKGVRRKGSASERRTVWRQNRLAASRLLQPASILGNLMKTVISQQTEHKARKSLIVIVCAINPSLISRTRSKHCYSVRIYHVSGLIKSNSLKELLLQ